MTHKAAETRKRIIDAASILFLEHGFDHVGVRDIASRASVNASLVNRYFGSKTALFSEIASNAFDIIGELQDVPSSRWGEHLARVVMRPYRKNDAANFNALTLLLRSSLSPEASAIVAEQLRVQFTLPLAARLTGSNRKMRATIAASYMIGFATMRFALVSQDIKLKDTDEIVRFLGNAMQSSLDPA